MSYPRLPQLPLTDLEGSVLELLLTCFALPTDVAPAPVPKNYPPFGNVGGETEVIEHGAVRREPSRR